jgi:hypothetical protein
MKKEQDYIRDIAEIRSMMERSSKFLSLSGWAGILAGIYALVGVGIAHFVLQFNPSAYSNSTTAADGLGTVIALALSILILALCTAVLLSAIRSKKLGEKLWNTSSKQLLINLLMPLIAGGFLILIFISKGLIAFIAPFSLLFYGLALYNGGKFTYGEVRIMGIIQMILGLVGCYFLEYGLILWALGFGLVHIGYGVYMHYRYER